MDKVKIILNGQEMEVSSTLTVLQVCQQKNIEVPFFCYHPKLSIAGNCRMCLVEVSTSHKLAASCSLKVEQGMVINTNTKKVSDARKGVLEFLLINHPLDCPVCDQGGECDLQDLSFAFGSGSSRYPLEKRAVLDKELGPLIKTAMTRCIHCTRCVRFSEEIAGTPELGAVGRGEDLEITAYIEKALTSELSGNMIDICPVGALTSKPGAFKKRSWELKKTKAIDIHDAVGSNIYIETRGNAIMQVRPRTNEDINEEWISDKSRFSYDGLAYQRLDTPYKKVNGCLQACKWEDALQEAAKQLGKYKGSKIAGLIGSLVDCESIFSFKLLLEQLNCLNRDSCLDGEVLKSSSREGYLFNTPISNIEKSDAVLLVGTNPRKEAPLINARWRKRFIKEGLTAGLVGHACDLSFPYDHLGETAQALKDIYKGDIVFSKKLREAKNPMIVMGMGALVRKDSQEIYDLCFSIAKKYSMITREKNNFNVLHTKASQVGALDLSFAPAKGGLKAKEIYKSVQCGEIKVLYLLGADDIALTKEDVKDTFVIYQGHHGDKGAHLADLILPVPAYTEKNGTYINTQGVAQESFKAVEPPEKAKEDWQIIRDLAQIMKKPLAYKTCEDLRKMMIKAHTIFTTKSQKTLVESSLLEKEEKDINTFTFLEDPLGSHIENFYMTDIICRQSPTMAACIESFYEKKEVLYG